MVVRVLTGKRSSEPLGHLAQLSVGGFTGACSVTTTPRPFGRGPLDGRISNGQCECDEIGRSDKTSALEHQE